MEKRRIKKIIYYGICIISMLNLHSYKCRNNTTKVPICKIGIKDIVKKDSDRLFISYRKENVGVQYSDITSDSTTRGVYFFDNSGILRSYKFFSLPTTYQYNEVYDSLGNKEFVEGSPLVLKLYNLKEADKLELTYLFFALKKNYDSVKVEISNGFSFKTALKANLVFTNILSTSFLLDNSKKLKSPLKVFTSGKYYDSCIGHDVRFSDTFNIKPEMLLR